MQHNKKDTHYFLPAKFYYDKAVLNSRQPFHVPLWLLGILTNFYQENLYPFWNRHSEPN